MMRSEVEGNHGPGGQLAHQVPVKDYEGEGDCDSEVTWSLEEGEDNEKRIEVEGNRGPVACMPTRSR